jgi:hypothetical protein
MLAQYLQCSIVYLIDIGHHNLHLFTRLRQPVGGILTAMIDTLEEALNLLCLFGKGLEYLTVGMIQIGEATAGFDVSLLLAQVLLGEIKDMNTEELTYFK